MGTDESNSSLGYGKPPWVFKGSALYQFHLVKAETARAFVPVGSKLVEAFGHTLGGFFLAKYEDSPVGSFDELVVIAGIVWNPPTSCAWAARVLVNSDKACAHGKRDVGLPSHVATFTKSCKAVPGTKRSLLGGILNKIGVAESCDEMKNHMDVQVKETDNHTSTCICSINLAAGCNGKPQTDSKEWMGPVVKLSLPSFSGRTEYVPDLLKYSCQIECRVRAVAPAKVLGPSASTSTSPMDGELTTSEYRSSEMGNDVERNLSISVMLSKPILALEFNCLKMKVDAPTVVSQCNAGRSGFDENSPGSL